MNLLFHIGYHKTATSLLQRKLFALHSETQLLNNTIHPWHDPLVSYLVRTLEQKFDPIFCRNLLMEAIDTKCQAGTKPEAHAYVVSAERLSGYPLSGGVDSAPIARKIQKAFPKARILIGVREQIDMILSSYAQIVREGFPGSLDMFLNHKGWQLPWFSQAFYEYDLLVSYYMELFGKENVLVVPFELLKQSKEQFIGEITSFLNVSPLDDAHVLQKANPGISLDLARALRLSNHFKRTELNAHPIINLPTKALDRIVSSSVKWIRKKNQPISLQCRTKIQEYYKDSNERLHVLTGIDFESFHAV